VSFLIYHLAPNFVNLCIFRWKGTGIGKIHVNKGAFLKDIDAFDNVEFGISSKDAQSMAPASRKLVENSFLALLDSGIDYRTKSVGVFTSGTSIDLMNVSEPVSTYLDLILSISDAFFPLSRTNSTLEAPSRDIRL